jgi:hypothetical protein
MVREQQTGRSNHDDDQAGRENDRGRPANPHP